MLPVRSKPNDSGMDVFVHHFEKVYTMYGDFDLKENVESLGFDGTQYILKTHDRILVATGLSVAVDPGYEIQVRPRSGNALNRGLSIVNSPGTIDADYRGPVGIIIINTGHFSQIIKVGEKIAQLVVAPICLSEIIEVEDLDETERGDGGFGSTGK
jgi:dUTP pyrophosphatase